MAESASTLGRKWLNTIPYYHTLRLTDFEVSTAIITVLRRPANRPDAQLLESATVV
jgi:hypothetical protein